MIYVNTNLLIKVHDLGTSLVVQWLRLPASNAGSMSSIPGRGTKIPHAAQRGQKINQYFKILFLKFKTYLWLFISLEYTPIIVHSQDVMFKQNLN